MEMRDLTSVLSEKDVRLLNKVNVDIPKGVIMGVIGPSGSGKSTFLRDLNRLWEPASGSMFLNGVDICELDVLSLRRKVGMLFQLPELFEGRAAAVASPPRAVLPSRRLRYIIGSPRRRSLLPSPCLCSRTSIRQYVPVATQSTGSNQPPPPHLRQV